MLFDIERVWIEPPTDEAAPRYDEFQSFAQEIGNDGEKHRRYHDCLRLEVVDGRDGPAEDG